MKRELELYLHIPFCVKKCAYCDFLSGPADEKQKRAYFDGLIGEIRGCGDFSEYVVKSIFFGGGTPSVVPGQWIERVMLEIGEHFCLAPEAEITIEVNPGTADREKLECYGRAGITRISFGCQSADNRELKRLGRIHTWEEFSAGYELARDCGFRNINVDLMSGLPGQNLASWENTLKKVIECSPEHISAYSLILEEGTPFYDMKDQLKLPEEEEERLMYERTAEILHDSGYDQYEISNYARPGFACEHNVGYWIGREYLGLGLGSSSLIRNCRFHNRDQMGEYLKYCENPGMLRCEVQELSVKDRMEEFMILGLRMTEGVSETQFEKLFHTGIDRIYGKVLEKYGTAGFLERERGRIYLTREGISVSNVILSEMLL